MERAFLLAVVILYSSCVTVRGQNAEEQKAIKLVIDKLFMGMQKGDSTMVKEVFTDKVTLATVYKNNNGAPAIHQESSLKDFLRAVGTAHTEVWNEEYWNLKIQIDGDFASAWCDYAFYLDDNFSHCGVDAFHFHKQGDGWKIFHLADTRRKDGCKIPAEIQQMHSKR